MKRELTTTHEVFDALDGVQETAKLVGATYKQAFNWKVGNSRFPSRFYLVMSQELERRGYRAPASLWGMVESERTAS